MRKAFLNKCLPHKCIDFRFERLFFMDTGLPALLLQKTHDIIENAGLN